MTTTTNTRTLEGQRAVRAASAARKAERDAWRARELERLDLDELIARRWQDAAACEGEGRRIGTTDAAEAAEVVEEFCAKCPVVQQCRTWADGDRQYEGVAGARVFKWTKIPVLVDGKVKQRDVRTVTAPRAIEGSVAA
jgi:hypothetical protein